VHDGCTSQVRAVSDRGDIAVTFASVFRKPPTPAR